MGREDDFEHAQILRVDFSLCVDSDKVLELEILVFLEHAHLPVDVRVENVLDVRKVHRQVKFAEWVVRDGEPVPNKQLIVILVAVVYGQLLPRLDLLH